MSSGDFHLVLYDGICNLCDGSVRWIIRHDKYDHFRFVSLQSEMGKTVLTKLNLPEKESNSVVYITRKGIFTRSSAVLQILHDVGNGWQLFDVFRIVPRLLREPVYDFIANTRYRIFGRKEYCEVHENLNHSRFVLSEIELAYLNEIIG